MTVLLRNTKKTSTNNTSHSLWLSHLRLSQHERSGHLEAFRSGQVLVELELVF